MTALLSPTNVLKAEIQTNIKDVRDTVVRLAHAIHGDPEIAFSEQRAAGRVIDVLAEYGFEIRVGICGLPTAFIATRGRGPLHIAFCAEYDALDDGIGHGCGHNLIAGAAVATAVSLIPVADELGLTLTVIGTPGEELLGLKEPPEGHLVSGKIVLLRGGAFDGVHAALMIHPGPTPYSEFATSQAGVRIRARYQRAIGAAQLERVIRASLEPLRQAPYFCRVVSEPASTNADMFIAAATVEQLLAAAATIRACLEEAARAAACAVDIIEFEPNAELRQDQRLAAAYRRNSEALGRLRERDPNIQRELGALKTEFLKRVLTHPSDLAKLVDFARHPSVGLFLDQPPVDVLYGTDLGNVSHAIPCIHPLVGIGGVALNNTAAFTPQADTDEAYRAMLDGATALAWTAVDAATDDNLRTYLLNWRR